MYFYPNSTSNWSTVCFTSSFSQNARVYGSIEDSYTKEKISSVKVIYAPGKGFFTDDNGDFDEQIPYGEYTFVLSLFGYVNDTVDVSINKPQVKLNFSMDTEKLEEVKVVADIIIDRKTPVAFSQIDSKQIAEELASQDLPLLLNTTPGITATQQGGGDGDARITVRGFDQTNVAVMIDGVPVNDIKQDGYTGVIGLA